MFYRGSEFPCADPSPAQFVNSCALVIPDLRSAGTIALLGIVYYTQK